jgi:membrane-bound ClpP family serine protease
MTHAMHWVITAAAYFFVLLINLAWVFGTRQQKVPPTLRRAVSISLKLAIVLAPLHWLFSACTWQAYAIVVVLFAVLFHIAPLWIRIPTPPSFIDALLAVFYALQQWVLGWPDRKLWIPDNPVSSAEASPNAAIVGESGIAITALRPVGRVRIADGEFDARAEHGFIELGSLVSVVGSDGFSLLVKSPT